MQQHESGNGPWRGISRYLTPLYFMYYVAFSMATYHLFKAYFGVYEIWRQRGIHLVLRV